MTVVFSVVALTTASSAAAPGGPRPVEAKDLVEEALTASGYRSTSSRQRARADFERHVGPIVQDLRRIPNPEQKAKLLLRALHRKGGLLGRYDTRATTLKDILTRRAFNCVSASVLYNVIAHRLSLPVAAQLLPTHARSLLSVERGGRLATVVIETTSPDGFEPDAAQQASILEAVGHVRDGRALVSDQGAIVDTEVLIGIIYVNRASIAQESGALERAEQLFALGQQRAREPSMRRVLMDQRAALLSQLAAADLAAGGDDRRQRALRSLRAAVRLSPASPEIAETVQQNLRALAEQLIFDGLRHSDERAVVTITGEVLGLIAAPADRAAVRAYAFNAIAEVRLNAGDIEGAVEHLERGMAERLSPDDASLGRMLQANWVASLRSSAFRRAEVGDLEGSERFLSRLARTMGEDSSRKTLTADLRRVFHLAGQFHLDQHQHRRAAEIFRTGWRRFPEDAVSRNNLIVALERIALPLVNEGRCVEAAPFIDEIQSIDESASFPADARLRCLMERAHRRLSAGDYAEAVRLMRSVDPAPEAIRQNLSVALLKWTAALARAGRCGEALIRAREAGALPYSQPAAVDAALGHCR